MKSDFFSGNRKKLGNKLKGGLVILTAFSKMQRTSDDAYSFEQEGNFRYLTGIEESDWWLIYDGTRDKSWLVRPDVDQTLVTFNGQLSDKQATKISAVNEIISYDDALSLIRQLKRSHNLVHTIKQPENIKRYGFVPNPAHLKMTDLLDRYFESVQDCRRELAVLRAIKQPEEVTQIKKAINITVDAYERVQKNLANYKYEYEIEADITHEFLCGGAEHGYSPIVASGKSSCTLHYSKNSSKLQNGKPILIDVGARLGGYSADITRTYSFGKPTKRLVEVHEAVCEAQASIIKSLRPTLSLQDLQHIVEKEMTEKLKKLNLVKEDPLTELPYYFPHAIGHGLGVDLHEPLAHETLQEGMVITIEPGIYIPEEGIGVRIEDDILITKKGASNLSAKLPTNLVY